MYPPPFREQFDTLGRYPPYVTREFVLLFPICFPVHTVPSKRFYSNSIELAPTGSKFFPFRVDPFSKEVKIILAEWPTCQKLYRFPLIHVGNIRLNSSGTWHWISVGSIPTKLSRSWSNMYQRYSPVGHLSNLSQDMRKWYLSHRRLAKAQASLRISAVSPEP